MMEISINHTIPKESGALPMIELRLDDNRWLMEIDAARRLGEGLLEEVWKALGDVKSKDAR